MHKNIEVTELDKFDAMAAEWWDPKGKCSPLHALNPTRLQFIVDRYSLLQKNVLDIGCGGGILSESLFKRGAYVTGIDASSAVLKVATLHAMEIKQQENNLHKPSTNTLNYIHTTAEEYATIHPNMVYCDGFVILIYKLGHIATESYERHLPGAFRTCARSLVAH